MDEYEILSKWMDVTCSNSECPNGQRFWYCEVEYVVEGGWSIWCGLCGSQIIDYVEL